MQGVYRIRNILDDKRYVGSTQDFDGRWDIHRDELRKGNHYNKYLQRAWNKYGEENFVFEVEEEVIGDDKALLAVEQVYLDEGFALGVLYNVARKAGGGNLGEEINRKRSEALKGKKRTEEQCQNISQSRKKYLETHDIWNKEKPLTEEHRRNIKTANEVYYETHDAWNKGLPKTEEAKQKLSESNQGEGNPFYGKQHTQKSLNKMSVALKEWHKIHEHPRGMLGKHHTQETRNRISVALKGRTPWNKGGHHTQETKDKLSQIGKGNEYGAQAFPSFYNENTGECIPAGYNLSRMCRERELSRPVMNLIKTGVTKQSQDGWRLAP